MHRAWANKAWSWITLQRNELWLHCPSQGRVLSLRWRATGSSCEPSTSYLTQGCPHQSPHARSCQGSDNPSTPSCVVSVTKHLVGAGMEQSVRAQALHGPCRGAEEGTCAGLLLLPSPGFSPKKVCEHYWRENQIGANSHAIYTDARLSFHSVTPSIKPFTIYALLLMACVFNHCSQHLPVSLARRDCSLGTTAFFLEGTLLSSKAEVASPRL